MPRVLVVDDDEQIRSLLRMVLEQAGHHVQDVADGVSAQSLCRQCPPDVVFMDLIMPNKEGIETIRELKRDHPAIKIIAISGGGRGSPEIYLTLAERLGAERGLSKPFSASDVLDAVNEVLTPSSHAIPGTPPQRPQA